MARFDRERGLLVIRLVYCGAASSGKTTNLRSLHDMLPEVQVGAVLDTGPAVERTLFFDYVLADLGQVAGLSVQAEIFTVPGQAYYREARRSVLEQADGIIFVADSSPDRWVPNLQAQVDVVQILASHGRLLDPSDLPVVYQWNKRDLPGAVSEARLEAALNRAGAPSFSAVAGTGRGVEETATAALQATLRAVRARHAHPET